MTTQTPFAAITAVATYLPRARVTTADLEAEIGDGLVAPVARKVGIVERRVSDDDEFTSDLAVRAADALFIENNVRPESIDFVLLCTQSPDYPMPTTACLVHHRLGLRSDSGALDIGMGCSGYVYGLGMATALIESGQAARVLLITADTMTKYLNRGDKQLRAIFGDGAAATLIERASSERALRGFSYGTDGAGAKHLLVPNGGLAGGARLSPESTAEHRGLTASSYDMYMNGAEVFAFTLRVVPAVVADALERAGLSMGDIDLFVFHQANAFMLETLRKKLGIQSERFVVEMAETGNTGSSSIPMALETVQRSGRAAPGSKVMLVGFGVGLSWGAMIATL